MFLFYDYLIFIKVITLSKFCYLTAKIHILADIPVSCIPHLEWAFEKGRVENPEWYDDMIDVVGVGPRDAMANDFQKYFKCENKQSKDCNMKGLQFPKNCSYPPCNKCRKGMVYGLK